MSETAADNTHNPLSALIVDDEPYAVEGIKTSIDWAGLGIGDVDTAFSAEEAKTVFLKKKIDFLLCDIEMPGESGLELVSWIREHAPETECVFLTCHAEFTYAKEAIRLGGFDYLLKPIPYEELESVIRRAIGKIVRDRNDNRDASRWRGNERVVLEHFWKEALNRSPRLSRMEIASRAQALGIDGGLPLRLVPVLLVIRRWRMKLTERDRALLSWAVLKTAEEMLPPDFFSGPIRLDECRSVLLVPVGTDASGLCRALAAFSGERLYCDAACYLGDITEIENLADTVDALREKDRLNVVGDSGVFFRTATIDTRPTTSALPDSRPWVLMLKEGSIDALRKDLFSFLDRAAAENSLSADFLARFHLDFMQAVYGALRSGGIRANEPLGDETSIELSRKAPDSLSAMKAWIRHSLERTGAALKSEAETDSPFVMAKRYIARNLVRDLSREGIAAQVGVSPDHLTRLFKKETGVSVMDWIVGERLEYARDLLIKTDMSVGEIAAHVGYTNFSHFAAIFKRRFSMNPSEVRGPQRR